MTTSDSFFPPPETPQQTGYTDNWDQELTPWQHRSAQYRSIPVQTTQCNKNKPARTSRHYQHRPQGKHPQMHRNKSISMPQWQISNPRNSSNEPCFSPLSPKLKRASHLPIIWAREQYGHIFKYTRPAPPPPSPSLVQRRLSFQAGTDTKPALPEIDRLIRRAGMAYDIYESCVVGVRRGELRERGDRDWDRHHRYYHPG